MNEAGTRRGEGGLRLEDIAKTFRQGGEALRILDRISLRVAPTVRSTAISRPVSFTSMIKLEMMLKAATRIISVRIRNMTLRSISKAEKNVALRWRQSVEKTGRPAAASTASRMSPTPSGSSR